MKKKSIVVVMMFLLLLVATTAIAGVNSTSIEVVTLANTPSNLQVDYESTTDDTLAVSWEANGNPINTFYTLEYSTDNETWTPFLDKKKDTLSTNITDLDGNTGYFLRVSSYNQAEPKETSGEYETGEGKLLYTKATKPDESQKPSLGMQTGQELTIEWENIDGTDTKLIMDDEVIAIYPVDEVPRTKQQLINELADLQPDTKYEFQIIYTNEAGDSEPSDVLIAWTDARPATDLEVIGRTNDTITVQINSNGNPANTTQYGFEIYDLEDNLIESTIKTDTEFTFTDLYPGRFVVKVNTYNSEANPNGDNLPKLIGTVDIVTGTVPPAPIIEVEKVTTNTMTVLLKPQYTVDTVFVLEIEGGEVVNNITKDDPAFSLNWVVIDGKDVFRHTFTNLHPNAKYIVKGRASYEE